MQTHKLQVQKTARYFVLGTPSVKIKQVWFICHGYGHLGNYFLKQFEPLVDETTLFVSCEGLNRFYLNGFSGRVGATWMTKEDRLDDIDDYVHYLDQVYDQVMAFVPPTVKVTLLGFSQGTATTCRWLALGKPKKTDTLILWAGDLPADVDVQAPGIAHTRKFIVVGSQDEFIREEEVQGLLKRLDEQGVRYELMRFEGKHELNSAVLKQFIMLS
ncbi:MAG TPA: phospholipase [Bacteroidia bacterium]|jgi:predicted esterase|nr:phospholipase [Bacteroidia bacterium]